MPRKRRATPGRRDELTPEQWSELVFGRGARASVWASPLDKRRAWYEHRDDLLSRITPGWRPAGFWAVEAVTIGPFQNGETNEQWLARHGLLGDAERIALDVAQRHRDEMRAPLPRED